MCVWFSLLGGDSINAIRPGAGFHQADEGSVRRAEKKRREAAGCLELSHTGVSACPRAAGTGTVAYLANGESDMTVQCMIDVMLCSGTSGRIIVLQITLCCKCCSVHTCISYYIILYCPRQRKRRQACSGGCALMSRSVTARQLDRVACSNVTRVLSGKGHLVWFPCGKRQSMFPWQAVSDGYI